MCPMVSWVLSLLEALYMLFTERSSLPPFHSPFSPFFLLLISPLILPDLPCSPLIYLALPSSPLLWLAPLSGSRSSDLASLHTSRTSIPVRLSGGPSRAPVTSPNLSPNLPPG